MRNQLDDDHVVAILLGIVLAMLLLPSTVSAWGARAGTWLVEHSALVPPHEALVTFPGLNAGADVRRLVILSAVGLALTLTVWIRWRSRQAEQR